MSGMEIAGLILGAVPLTIAALKQYKTAHEMLRSFKRKSLLIDRLIGVLQEQEFCLESEFTLLLRAAGCTINGEDMQALLVRDDITKDLKGYLGRAYEPYLNALIGCKSSLEDIVKRIWGLVPGSPSNDLNELLKANKSQDGAHKSRGRIKFALRRDELEERISDLVDSINRLGKLRDISASLQDYSIQHCSRTMAEVAAFLQHVQDNAKLLYGAMERELASGCHNEHATRFYLEGHSAVLQKRQMPTIFKLALEAPEARMVGQDLDREISIEVLDDDMDGPISEEEFEKAGVGFVLTDPSKAPDELMSKALDMCLAIDRARKEGKTMKMSLSPCGALHGWYILPLFGERTDRDHSTFELVTLEQVLLKKLCHEPSRLEWNVIQRMNLSLNLASSLLQLCSTPWLSEPWTKRTICFRRRLRPTPASGVAFVFEPDRPFLVHSFSERPIACPTNELEPRYQLLNLGILLLELGHEKPIELWASAHGYNLDKAYGNRYEAAAAWLRDSVGELLPSYFDAAGRCIECTFCTRSAIPKWDDPEFRKSICEWVIQPLWSNCSSTMSI